MKPLELGLFGAAWEKVGSDTRKQVDEKIMTKVRAGISKVKHKVWVQVNYAIEQVWKHETS